MNPTKCNPSDYINFQLATPKSYSLFGSGQNTRHWGDSFAHDACNRLLQRLESEPSILWQEAQPYVGRQAGVLIIDNTTLDKPYANKIELVGQHWSGKHKQVVKGINLISILWTEGFVIFPVITGNMTKPIIKRSKNDHFTSMLQQAKECGLQPQCIVFGSWYSSLDNLVWSDSSSHKDMVGSKCGR